MLIFSDIYVGLASFPVLLFKKPTTRMNFFSKNKQNEFFHAGCLFSLITHAKPIFQAKITVIFFISTKHLATVNSCLLVLLLLFCYCLVFAYLRMILFFECLCVSFENTARLHACCTNCTNKIKEAWWENPDHTDFLTNLLISCLFWITTDHKKHRFV